MTRQATWSNIGVTSSTNNLENLLKEADLDYNVIKQDLRTEVNGSEIIVPNYKATVREDTGEVFGIVTDRYKVCQNSEALDFVNLIEGIQLLKAGQSGANVYLISQLPEVTVLGDTFAPHLIFQNSHDGSSSVKATITMLRIICQNQFTRSFAESPATISISHMGDMASKLDIAQDTMIKAYDHIKCFKDEAEGLATKKITPTRLNKILEKFYYTSPEFSDRKNQRIQDERDRFMNAFKEDDNANFTKSMWGLVNAYADVLTHQEPARKTANWEANQFMWMLNPQLIGAFIEACKAA